MTSRRPMTRSFSGNGRSGSFNHEEEDSSSNGRPETRNPYLSNVRPENSYSSHRYSGSHYRPPRSTLCSVMAQLSEDIQPSFETTLKSKAVSESCNVKFSCVVSGYPTPELTWYKDDMELDRYCGLPKYEIRRNGKTHTLHIYNCTVDDAAIYQVSACNSKGIVSCSGVLEVGVMDEFKIHQRFFAKLKQKAENKKRELEENRRRGMENVRSSPQRKRHSPVEAELAASAQAEAAEMPAATAGEPNGVGAEVSEKALVAPMENGRQTPDHDLEKVLITAKPPTAEVSGKKKIRVSNGLDDGPVSNSSSSSHSVQGSAGENSYDGGRALAQFLAETRHCQAAEDRQNPAARLEKTVAMDTSKADGSKERDRDAARERQEKERALEKERERKTKERERERERELGSAKKKELSQRTTPGASAAKVKMEAHKESEHHNIQASISSVLHSVKDFFFGKNKKGHPCDEEISEERARDYPVAPTLPSPSPPPLHPQEPYGTAEVYKPLEEEAVPLEVESPQEASVNEASEAQPVLLEQLTPNEHKHTVTVLHIEEHPVLHTEEHPVLHTEEHPVLHTEEHPVLHTEEHPVLHTEEHPILHTEEHPPSPERPPGDVADSAEQRDVEMCAEVVSDRPEAASTPGLPGPSEVAGIHSQSVPVIQLVVPALHQVNIPVLLLEPHHQATSDDTPAVPSQGPWASSMSPEATMEAGLHTTNPISMYDSSSPTDGAVSLTDGRCLTETADSETEEEMHVDMSVIVSDYVTQDKHSPSSEETRQDDEVTVEIQSCPNVEESVEMIHLEKPALEERVDTFDSMASTPRPHVLGENAKIEAQEECIIVPQENGERDYSKTEEESVPVLQERAEEAPMKGCEESTEDVDSSIKEISPSALEEREEEGTLKAALEERLANNSVSNLGIQEQELQKAEESTVEMNEKNDNSQESEALTLKIESEVVERMEMQTMVDVLDGSSSHSETQPEKDVIVPGEPLAAPISGPDANTSYLGGFFQSVPEKNIFDSAPEELPEIKLTVPEAKRKEPMIIPQIEIMEPEDEEPMLPSKLSESQPAFFPNDEATDESDITITVDRAAASPVAVGVTPVHDSAQDDDLLPPMEKVQKVAQQDEKTVTLNGEKPNKVGSESFPAMNQLIPTINVSCTDDLNLRDDDLSLAKPLVLDTPPPEEAPKMPLFVVPLISVSLNETKQSLRTEPTVSESLAPSLGNTVESANITEADRVKSPKETKMEADIERLGFKNPTSPMVSPASLRRFLAKSAAGADAPGLTAAVPAITVGDAAPPSDRTGEELSGGSTPTSSLSRESSPRLKRRDSLTLIRSATPEELALGARRKIFIAKTPGAEGEGAGAGPGALDAQGKKDAPYLSPGQARRAAFLQTPAGSQTPPLEKRSPLLARRKTILDVPKALEETPAEEPDSTAKETPPAETEKFNPFKAPQVIRKIRGEAFADASGHLKLWCQFFNVLSESTIKWCRDDEEIAEVQRSGGDESQVALAIVQASSRDCGVYSCTIKNEYGTDSTDFLLSVDILSEFLLREDLEVGEEIEMTPLLFSKGLGDTGVWGDKFFGRIMTEEAHLGEACAHKASRVKVIYGLDPVFESGSTCIIKVQNPIAYGTKEDSNLTERNLEITKQECKIQNMVREYCKIFAAEARVIENFGSALEVIPQYLMYRPANSVPYATVEVYLQGVFLKYCLMDDKGRLIMRTQSEVEQKCCAFQHWIHQWTHGNLLVIQLEGVGMKITHVRVATKSKGYQGLTDSGSPKVFEKFQTQHQCNYYCGLLGLRSLKTMDSLQQPPKAKGSRSPLLNRKLGTGSSSPQLQKKLNSPQTARKITSSPQTSRKTTSSPKVARKTEQTEDDKSKTEEIPMVVTMT